MSLDHDLSFVELLEIFRNGSDVESRMRNGRRAMDVLSSPNAQFALRARTDDIISLLDLRNFPGPERAVSFAAEVLGAVLGKLGMNAGGLLQVQLVQQQSAPEARRKHFWTFVLSFLRQGQPEHVGPYVGNVITPAEKYMGECADYPQVQPVFLVFRELAQRYPVSLAPRFDDVMDQMLGWCFDPITSQGSHKQLLDLLPTFHNLWNTRTDFTPVLLKRFCADMEDVMKKFESGKQDGSRRFRILLRCFHVVLGELEALDYDTYFSTFTNYMDVCLAGLKMFPVSQNIRKVLETLRLFVVHMWLDCQREKIRGRVLSFLLLDLDIPFSNDNVDFWYRLTSEVLDSLVDATPGLTELRLVFEAESIENLSGRLLRSLVGKLNSAGLLLGKLLLVKCEDAFKEYIYDVVVSIFDGDVHGRVATPYVIVNMCFEGLCLASLRCNNWKDCIRYLSGMTDFLTRCERHRRPLFLLLNCIKSVLPSHSAICTDDIVALVGKLSVVGIRFFQDSTDILGAINLMLEHSASLCNTEWLSRVPASELAVLLTPFIRFIKIHSSASLSSRLLSGSVLCHYTSLMKHLGSEHLNSTDIRRCHFQLFDVCMEKLSDCSGDVRKVFLDVVMMMMSGWRLTNEDAWRQYCFYHVENTSDSANRFVVGDGDMQCADPRLFHSLLEILKADSWNGGYCKGCLHLGSMDPHSKPRSVGLMLYYCANFLVLNKLRTSFGSPKDTFNVLEQILMSVAQCPVSAFCESVVERGREALELMFLLERTIRKISTEYSTLLHSAQRDIGLFFQLNERACYQWFSRLRAPSLAVARRIKYDAGIMRHAMQYIEDLVESLKDEKNDSQVPESLHVIGQIRKSILLLCEMLCEKGEDDAIDGWMKWYEIFWNDSKEKLFLGNFVHPYDENTACLGFLRGLLHEARGNFEAAMSAYEEVLRRLCSEGLADTSYLIESANCRLFSLFQVVGTEKQALRFSEFLNGCSESEVDRTTISAMLNQWEHFSLETKNDSVNVLNYPSILNVKLCESLWSNWEEGFSGGVVKAHVQHRDFFATWLKGELSSIISYGADKRCFFQSLKNRSIPGETMAAMLAGVLFGNANELNCLSFDDRRVLLLKAATQLHKAGNVAAAKRIVGEIGGEWTSMVLDWCSVTEDASFVTVLPVLLSSNDPSVIESSLLASARLSLDMNFCSELTAPPRAYLLHGNWCLSTGTGLMRKGTETGAPDKSRESGMLFLERSVESYFKFLETCNSAEGEISPKVLDVLLRLLRMLAKYGEGLESQFRTGFSNQESKNDVRAWAQVIPQLLSLLGANSEVGRDIIISLLERISRFFPSMLVYPAVFEATAAVGARVQYGVLAASIEKYHPHLVQEVRRIRGELVRVALLWDEWWMIQLMQLHTEFQRRTKTVEEHANRVFSNPRMNDDEKLLSINRKFRALMKPVIMAIKKALHLTFGKGICTAHEKEFSATFRSLIDEAMSLLEGEQTKEMFDKHWKRWGAIVKTIRKFNISKESLQLRDISPVLADLKGTGIPVPGEEEKFHISEYGNSSDVPESVVVQSFEPVVQILPTKTRPKKIGLTSSDGRRCTYLLKGREDLHLDARVMQLLRVINVMLQSNAKAREKALQARHYSVTPLGDRSGLIRWVDGTVPIYGLVQDWHARNVVQNAERSGEDDPADRTYHPIDVFYDKLKPILGTEGISCDNRATWPVRILVDILKTLMSEAPKKLLSERIWLDSKNMSDWLCRRTNFTRSLAVMSAVGYVLGLGDRHLGNLLLDLRTSEIVHIDYNICFDKGTHLRVPEVVPFRLTPILMDTFGLPGTEGVFRGTCEMTLDVLKQRRETLLSILEAFVYDPLVDWTANRVDDAQRREVDAGVTASLFGVRMEEMRSSLYGLNDASLRFITKLEASVIAANRSISKGIEAQRVVYDAWRRATEELKQNDERFEELNVRKKYLLKSVRECERRKPIQEKRIKETFADFRDYMEKYETFSQFVEGIGKGTIRLPVDACSESGENSASVSVSTLLEHARVSRRQNSFLSISRLADSKRHTIVIDRKHITVEKKCHSLVVDLASAIERSVRDMQVYLQYANMYGGKEYWTNHVSPLEWLDSLRSVVSSEGRFFESVNNALSERKNGVSTSYAKECLDHVNRVGVVYENFVNDAEAVRSFLSAEGSSSTLPDAVFQARGSLLSMFLRRKVFGSQLAFSELMCSFSQYIAALLTSLDVLMKDRNEYRSCFRMHEWKLMFEMRALCLSVASCSGFLLEYHHLIFPRAAYPVAFQGLMDQSNSLVSRIDGIAMMIAGVVLDKSASLCAALNAAGPGCYDLSLMSSNISQLANDERGFDDIYRSMLSLLALVPRKNKNDTGVPVFAYLHDIRSALEDIFEVPFVRSEVLLRKEVVLLGDMLRSLSLIERGSPSTAASALNAIASSFRTFADDVITNHGLLNTTQLMGQQCIQNLFNLADSTIAPEVQQEVNTFLDLGASMDCNTVRIHVARMELAKVGEWTTILEMQRGRADWNENIVANWYRVRNGGSAQGVRSTLLSALIKWKERMTALVDTFAQSCKECENSENSVAAQVGQECGHTTTELNTFRKEIRSRRRICSNRLKEANDVWRFISGILYFEGHKLDGEESSEISSLHMGELNDLIDISERLSDNEKKVAEWKVELHNVLKELEERGADSIRFASDQREAHESMVMMKKEIVNDLRSGIGEKLPQSTRSLHEYLELLRDFQDFVSSLEKSSAALLEFREVSDCASKTSELLERCCSSFESCSEFLNDLKNDSLVTVEGDLESMVNAVSSTQAHVQVLKAEAPNIVDSLQRLSGACFRVLKKQEESKLVPSHEKSVPTEKNAYALSVLKRVKGRLQGKEKLISTNLSVSEQVSYIIGEAMSLDNLAKMYEGYCAWI